MSIEKVEEFFSGMSEILEVESVDESTPLENDDVDWDSLAIISTIALVDTIYGKSISGSDLEDCKIISDLLKLI